MNQHHLQKKIVVITIVALLCGSVSSVFARGRHEQTGTGLGALGGALIGSQFGHGRGHVLGALAGGIVGAFAGNMIGRQMDMRDQMLAQQAYIRTLEHSPDRSPRTWRNPNNNHRGRFMVTNTQEFPRQNLVCRDYVHTVTIDGRQERLHGRACRDIRDTRAQWFTQQG